MGAAWKLVKRDRNGLFAPMLTGSSRAKVSQTK
jgi:hypothetical protein